MSCLCPKNVLQIVVPVDHIWKFDLEEYELRNFGLKFNFLKIRTEHVLTNFIAKTEFLRNTRT